MFFLEKIQQGRPPLFALLKQNKKIKGQHCTKEVAQRRKPEVG
jgi:hypothetical protein